MTRSPTGLLRGLALVHGEEAPLYRQICEHVRAAIRAGQLRPGDRVPSARDLAARFGTARGTVDAAYAILGGEGYLISRGAGGTVVSAELDSRAVARAASQRRPRSRAEPPGTHKLLPLQLGLPALDAFPRKVWSRLVARHARAFAPTDMAYPEPSGYRPLREAIARYLASSRGVRCTAEQILITNGYQDALNLAATVLLRPRDKVWLEDPGYPLAADALKAAGAALVPIRVDGEGLHVSEAVARARRARLAVVTRHHIRARWASPCRCRGGLPFCLGRAARAPGS